MMHIAHQVQRLSLIMAAKYFNPDAKYLIHLSFEVKWIQMFIELIKILRYPLKRLIFFFNSIVSR